ncbi:MAG: glutamate racemase [bacterium]
MIGIFDSGYGGLAVFKSIIKRLPRYSYLYFGDNAHAPYGSRPASEIFQYTVKGVEMLFSRGCRLVILACNTASATSLRRIQQELLPQTHPSHRVLGIVVPTIEQITWAAHDDIHTVGLLATAHTINSKAYQHEIKKRHQSIRIVSLACPDLVRQIEQGADKTQLQQSIKHYLKELHEKASGELDSVLLGCTHFELIADLIKKNLPPSVHLYKQPDIVAESLADYLPRHPDLAAGLSRQSRRLFITSGDPRAVSARASELLGYPVRYHNCYS